MYDFKFLSVLFGLLFMIATPVWAKPVAKAQVYPLEGFVPLRVTLDASSSQGDIEEYEWTVSSSEKEPPDLLDLYGERVSLLLDEPGKYTISLKVTDNDSVSDTLEDVATVTVKGFEACFEASRLEGHVAKGQPLKVELDASCSTGESIVDYQWEVKGRPATQKGQKITQSFYEKGDHTISLRVVNSRGETSTPHRQTITVNALIAKAVVSPTQVVIGEEVKLDATYSEPKESLNYLGYKWVTELHHESSEGCDEIRVGFDDNTAKNANMSFLGSMDNKASCRYVVTLQVTDQDDVTSEDRVTVEVSRKLTRPHAKINSVSPHKGFAPLTLNLDGSDSFDEDGSITQYTWLASHDEKGFGFEKSTSSAQTMLTLEQSGTYTISLFVTDNDDENSDRVVFKIGDKDEIAKIEIANERPIAKAKVLPSLDNKGERIPLEVILDASESHDNDGKLEKYTWTITNDSGYEKRLENEEPKISYLFEQVGFYQFSLVVTDNNGVDSEANVIDSYQIAGTLSIEPQTHTFSLPESFLPKTEPEPSEPPPSESEPVSETEPAVPSPSESEAVPETEPGASLPSDLEPVAESVDETDSSGSSSSEDRSVPETRRTRKRAEYWPGLVIVKFSEGTSTEIRAYLREFYQAQFINALASINAEVWQVENVEEAIATQSRQAFSGIVSIRPDYVIRAQDIRTMNDNLLRRKSRDKEESVSIETKEPVLCAVIDSGVDYTHPDLKPYIWTNLGEIPDNNLDDDGNGYVDDVHGYDFVNDNGEPTDDCGHGTHVAGIAANLAKNDENRGVTLKDETWPARIIALKILTPEIGRYGTDCVGSYSNAIRALEYVQKNAKTMGIKCTNNSWSGGNTFDQDLANAIQIEANEGRLFIAAAGNDFRQDNDALPYYPASYDLDNIISVCSVEQDGSLSDFSNFGKTSVDLCALGRRVKSTYPIKMTADPKDPYKEDNGTSMAAPYVTAAVTVLWSAYPNLSLPEVKKHILASAKRIPGLETVNVTGGRLSLRQAASNIKSQRQTFTISNTGHSDLKIDNVILAGDNPGEFQIRYNGCSSQKLAPKTDCTVDVSFEPTSLGNKKARLEVISNTPLQQTAVASLSSRLNNMITSLGSDNDNQPPKTDNEPAPPAPQKPVTDLAQPSIYHVEKGELDIPTVALKGNHEKDVIYQVKLSALEGHNPLRFKLVEIKTSDNAVRKLGDSIFDETTGFLNIPFVELGKNSRIFYEIDMGMVTNPDEFELQKAIPIH
ncbi:MAG: S8 family serine peptidase [Candidatus Parabeggiatoa sp.]|nr:S8 family serine peptidase [Candidatus Parabeggiatoa sp.]